MNSAFVPVLSVGLGTGLAAVREHPTGDSVHVPADRVTLISGVVHVAAVVVGELPDGYRVRIAGREMVVAQVCRAESPELVA